MGDVDFESLEFWVSFQDPMGDFDFESMCFWVSFQDPMKGFDFERVRFWVSCRCFIGMCLSRLIVDVRNATALQEKSVGTIGMRSQNHAGRHGLRKHGCFGWAIKIPWVTLISNVLGFG